MKSSNNIFPLKIYGKANHWKIYILLKCVGNCQINLFGYKRLEEEPCREEEEKKEEKNKEEKKKEEKKKINSQILDFEPLRNT